MDGSSSCHCQCLLPVNSSILPSFLLVVLAWQVAVRHTDVVFSAQDVATIQLAVS